MPRSHVIYVMSKDLKQQADLWVGNKFTKKYGLIKMKENGSPSGKLKQVKNDTILYIYTHSNGHTGRVWKGGDVIGAADLARHLSDEGLNPGHVEIKVFSCFSGTPLMGGATSFAKALFDCLRAPPFNFPRVVVYGYHGEVNPAGHDGRKSAGLGPKELPNALTAQAWRARNLRAKEQREKFGDVPLSDPSSW